MLSYDLTTEINTIYINHLADKDMFKVNNITSKETLAQVFSCEFCEISKNSFFYRTPLVAAFEAFMHL